MKRLFFLAWILCMLMTMAACGQKETTHVKSSHLILNPTTQSTEPSESAATAETTQATEPSVETEPPEETVPQNHSNYTPIYDDLTRDFALLIRYRFSDAFNGDMREGIPGISNTLTSALQRVGDLSYRWDCMVAELSPSELPKEPGSFGYILLDLNKDGVPELFWVNRNYTIVAVFTCFNDQAVLLDAYWSRYRAHVPDANTLWGDGSSGAASHNSRMIGIDANGKPYEKYALSSNYGSYTAYTNGVAETISEARYQELSSKYFSYSTDYWQSLHISPLPTLSDEDLFESYLVQIPRADFPIRKGPGYAYPQAGTVEVAATYTIVGESTDEAGNLWGKLKSGAGWVDLTLLEEEKKPLQISVDYADQDFMENGVYIHRIIDTSDDPVHALLRISASVTDVSFFPIDRSIYFEEGEELFHLDTWDASMPLVADINFPGDMSSYGIRFTDRYGNVHRYQIGISLKDGSIGISSYTLTD